jgi:hypothetical protein
MATAINMFSPPFESVCLPLSNDICFIQMCPAVQNGTRMGCGFNSESEDKVYSTEPCCWLLLAAVACCLLLLLAVNTRVRVTTTTTKLTTPVTTKLSQLACPGPAYYNY